MPDVMDTVPWQSVVTTFPIGRAVPASTVRARMYETLFGVDLGDASPALAKMSPRSRRIKIDDLLNRLVTVGALVLQSDGSFLRPSTDRPKITFVYLGEQVTCAVDEKDAIVARMRARTPQEQARKRIEALEAELARTKESLQ